jgi:hypothetical protein
LRSAGGFLNVAAQRARGAAIEAAVVHRFRRLRRFSSGRNEPIEASTGSTSSPRSLSFLVCEICEIGGYFDPDLP